MPPFLPRKRTPPPASPSLSTARKRTKLNDVLDADPGQSFDLQAARNFSLGDDDESDSSLSNLASDEFEDVSPAGGISYKEREEKGEDQDEDIDWEDAMAQDGPVKKKHVSMMGGNLELNLSRNLDEMDQYDFTRAATNTKKGPTKIEREIRLQTHCMHVQFLLHHNAIRNSWVRDKEVQDILVKQLPPGIEKEIQKWRVASGLETAREVPKEDTTSASKSKKKGKGAAAGNDRSQRDWGQPSNRLESGKPDLSRGDPIIPLLKVLAAYWKKRFLITAPGLRKCGYAPAAARQRQIRSFQNEKHDPEKHGERIENLSVFRNLARKCQGSRDVGAQLFTALLHGIGIESRLVASLQPSGFGWTKNEQAEIKTPGKVVEHGIEESSSDVSIEEDDLFGAEKSTMKKQKKKWQASAGRKGDIKGKGHSNDPVNLDTSSSEESALSEDDHASMVEITHATTTRKPFRYDRDLTFPIYWTEVVSPINSAVIPVSPLVLPNSVASTPEILSTFEPRGAKADNAKQVIAYVIAYSSDGSAKDVTTRYLKRQMWPGKTKGVRIPSEKVPVYNKRGKVLRYEEYDWFKNVMSGYVRTVKMRTAVDDVEDLTDLVPQQPERKDNKQEGDTLQSLRSSAEFVLERFLRREEALKPNAKPVRTFTTGKGAKLKEENVYLRANVERCLSAESWHKEGRQIREGEAPMKLVPIRAVTLTRKREVEEMQRQTGEKPTQGLYSRAQTEYIIPPPIKDGVIPRNGYGNIDCFVPSMVPKGAVHVPMRGTVRICKKLEIDYAEAVTGFEFGKKLAVPVIEGVVIAEEHEQAVRDAWKEYAEQQRVKEENKLEKAVLALWKRMLMGLRIRERVSDTYGDDAETSDMALDDVGRPGKIHVALPRGHDFDGEDAASVYDLRDGGGFLLSQENEEDRAASSIELVVEHDDPLRPAEHNEAEQYPTPISTASLNTKKPARNPKYTVVTSDTSDLSEAESTSYALDREESSIKQRPARERKGPATEQQQNSHIVVEIPKKTRRDTQKKSETPGPMLIDEEAGIALAGPSIENDNNPTKGAQASTTASGGKRTSGRKKKSASGQTLPPKHKQQPRRASRKAALTSPYFNHESDGDGHE